MLTNAAISALLNVIILAAIPFTAYYLYLRRRKHLPTAEIIKRTGLQRCDARYVALCGLLAAALVTGILIWPPALEPMTRKGSSWKDFVGLGLGWDAIVLALLYGVIKTGFAEEFLFRGLIAGSLARHLSPGWANVLQAIIFLLPHLILLAIMPEMWPILIAVFVFAWIVGWVRIKSGSIIGPWLVHAAANMARALSVATRTGN